MQVFAGQLAEHVDSEYGYVGKATTWDCAYAKAIADQVAAQLDHLEDLLDQTRPDVAEALAREVLGTLAKAREVMGGYELWRGSEGEDEPEPAPEADTLAARREVLEPWVDAGWVVEWNGDFRLLNYPDECEQAFPEKSDAFAAGAAVNHYAARVVEAGGTVGDGPPSS